MRFTFSGKTVLANDGRTYRFSVEYGDKVGVSSDGFLYTRRHPGDGYRGNQRGSDRRNGRGYFAVTLEGHSAYVHQMVFELFSGLHVPAGMEVDHIDGDRHNNSIGNLRMVTKSGNMRNEVTRRRNLKQLSTVRHLAFSARTRPVDGIGEDGVVTEYSSVTEASRKTGACRTDIARVARGERAHAAGFKWRYHK